MTSITPNLLDFALVSRTRSARGRFADFDRRRRHRGRLRLRDVVRFAAVSARRIRGCRRPRRRRAPARCSAGSPRRRAPAVASPRRRQSVRRPGRIRRAAAHAPPRRSQRLRFAGRVVPQFAVRREHSPPAASSRRSAPAARSARSKRRRPPRPSRRPPHCSMRRCRPSAKSLASTIWRRCRRPARANLPRSNRRARRDQGRSAPAARSGRARLRRARHDQSRHARRAGENVDLLDLQPAADAAGRLRRPHRRLRHHRARALYARRRQDRGAFGPRRVHGRSQSRQRASARRDAARSLRPAAARIAVPRRSGDPAGSGRRRRGDLRPRRPARPSLHDGRQRRFRTAACRSRTTTPSSRRSRTARSPAWRSWRSCSLLPKARQRRRADAAVGGVFLVENGAAANCRIGAKSSATRRRDSGRPRADRRPADAVNRA